MKVLSLFDGISCARVALERAGIPVEQYFASEIDKYAIQISKKNYPDIVQIGSVTGINSKVSCLSGVYDILKSYDTNIQNYFSEQEMLYWLNQNFSISAKIRTQVTNGNTSESATVQRIEEIWFSKRGVEDIIKTQYLIPSRTIRENGNLESQELLLQCGEWGYVCRIDTGNKAENIQGIDGEKTKTRKHRKNQTVSNQAVQQSTITNITIGADKKRNVETREPQEISNRTEEPKEWCTKEITDRIEKTRSFVREIGELISKWNENERTPEKEWNLLSIHKEMETTVVKTDSTIDIFTGTFEVMCGGSPCQDLSIAKKDRKGLDGEKSGLFWEYVRILKEVKPKYFILENVASMPKEAKETITKTLGVEPIMINAALVSAQNRKRLFWTNIPNVTLPEDRGILLKDIIETDEDSIYQYRRTYWRETKSGKVPTLTANMGTGGNNIPYVVALTEARTEEAKRLRSEYMKKTGKDFSPRRAKELVARKDGKSNTITTGATKESLLLSSKGIRKLTPIECERLQGLPDNYTEGISNTQRYKCLGNAFNVDVIAHILSFIKQ